MALRVSDPLPAPKYCDACGSDRVEFQPETSRYEARYYCYRCSAVVYCHKNTNIPLGYMASSSTRRLRTKAHDKFDRLWKDNLITRDEAYEWLSQLLSVDRDEAHIGRISVPNLRKVIDKAARYHKKLNVKNRKRRKKDNATYRRFSAHARTRKSGGRWKPDTT